VVLMFCIRIM